MPTINSRFHGHSANKNTSTHHTNKAARKGGFFNGASSMIKRLFLALAFIAGLASPVYAAGTIPLSMTQQFDTQGRLLAGGKLYFYQAGTTTPQSAYQDAALTIPLPNPITLDATARVPAFFLADGSIKVRLTSSAGVVQLAADGVLVIGASSGGGGGSPVDATTILATGDLKARYGTGNLTGFVRLNGRTIGSATSGATERANADAQSLFEYLWGADANLVVSTGRGASANADWVANKQLTLPDWRGRALAALDDMGNSAAGRLTSTYFGTSAIVLGASGGVESLTLTAAQLPANIPYNDPGHRHDMNADNSGPGTTNYFMQGNTTGSAFPNFMQIATTGITINPGGGAAHRTVQPTMLATFYCKL